MLSLDSLPLDVQYNVMSWLLCPLAGHKFERAPQTQGALIKADLWRLSAPKYAGSNKYTGNHPFLCLAATNRTLRSSVEDYCHHLVMKRLTMKSRRIVAPKYADWNEAVTKTAKKIRDGDTVPAANLRCYRLQLLKWSHETCLFCGKKSTRRAIFNLQMWACKHCDDKEFGIKMSKSEAKTKYRLTELHFKYPHYLWPDAYTKGIDFAFANLPVYQGALMLKDADLAHLAAHMKAHPPSASQMRELKAQIDTADRFSSNLQFISKEREVIRRLNTLIDTLLSETPLPADSGTFTRISNIFAICRLELRRNPGTATPGPTAMVFIERAAYQRVIAWWQHLIPSRLAKDFSVREGVDEHGRWKQGLYIHVCEPPSQMYPPDPEWDSRDWAPVSKWIPSPVEPIVGRN